MKRIELIAALKSKSFVKLVFDVELLKKEDSVKIYEVGFFENGATTSTAIKRSCQFYVIDEGEDTEEAFYKDREPKPTLKETSGITKRWASAAKTLKLNIVSKGENFNIYEGFETQENGDVLAVRYIADMDEYRKMYID